MADTIDEDDLPSHEDFMAYLVRTRGDVYPETTLLATEVPDTVYFLRRTSGYVHAYDELTTPDQVLSGPMRELIALPQLCAQGDGRFAANHVRRLYRMGVTDRVMLEAAEAIAPVVGWSTILQVARAIGTANDPAYTNGAMPPGGKPTTLTPFAELEMGHKLAAGREAPPETLMATPEWAYVAGIDPELARRASTFVDHCSLGRGKSREGRLLGPGVRELVAIAALCARGEEELAVQHIRRAYAYGMTRRQVLEAISCVLPMTGSITVLLGARAMQAADRAEGGKSG